MQQLPRQPATIQPSSPPVETEPRAANQQLLQKVEGNFPYLCYAGVGLFLLLSLLQPAIAAFALSCWALWWILCFSFCAMAIEPRHDPAHWSHGFWLRKYVRPWEVGTAESWEEVSSSSQTLSSTESAL
jgi:hypothetical protein